LGEIPADALMRELGARDFDPRGFFVYILWDAEDEAVYVGQSANILSRLGNHMQDAEKRGQTVRASFIRCETRREMDATEAWLISKLDPKLNIALTDKPRSVRRKAIAVWPTDAQMASEDAAADARWIPAAGRLVSRAALDQLVADIVTVWKPTVRLRSVAWLTDALLAIPGGQYAAMWDSNRVFAMHNLEWMLEYRLGIEPHPGIDGACGVRTVGWRRDQFPADLPASALVTTH
jgi:hypothetical protein